MRLIKFHNTPSHFEHDKTLLVVLKIVYLNTAKNQQKIKAMVIQLLANLLHVCLYKKSTENQGYGYTAFGKFASRLFILNNKL